MSDLKRYVTQPIFINEHGAWAMLFVPAAMGIIQAGRFDDSVYFFIAAILFAFFAYRPFEIIAREGRRANPQRDKILHALVWLGLYLFMSLLSGLPLLLIYRKWGLIPYFLFALGCFIVSVILSSRFRSVYGRDFFAIAGMAGLAPASYFLITDRFDQHSIFLWLMNTGYFLSSSFYVHMKMLANANDLSGQKLNDLHRRRDANTYYQFALFFGSAALAAFYFHSVFALLAYLPMIVHALNGSRSHRERVNFKKIGFAFLGYSILFIFFISIA